VVKIFSLAKLIIKKVRRKEMVKIGILKIEKISKNNPPKIGQRSEILFLKVEKKITKQRVGVRKIFPNNSVFSRRVTKKIKSK
jgi:hypothetical protein